MITALPRFYGSAQQAWGPAHTLKLVGVWKGTVRILMDIRNPDNSRDRERPRKTLHVTPELLNTSVHVLPQPSAGFSSAHGGSSAYAALNPDGSQRAWMRRSVSTVMLDELLPPDSSHRSATARYRRY